jgi:hypothetical protein
LPPRRPNLPSGRCTSYCSPCFRTSGRLLLLAGQRPSTRRSAPGCPRRRGHRPRAVSSARHASVRCRAVSRRQYPFRCSLKERPRRFGPPAWDDPPVEAVPDWDTLSQPQPEYVFDQQVQW